jgi:hypothetical protein
MIDFDKERLFVAVGSVVMITDAKDGKILISTYGLHTDFGCQSIII